MDIVKIQYNNLPSVEVNLAGLSKTMARASEVPLINVSTYASLEIDFAKAFMEAKATLAKIGHLKTVYMRELDKTKLRVLFDDYASFIASKDKKQDTVMVKELFLNTHPEVVKIQEEIDKISFLEGYLESAVRTFDNISRVMKKQIDIVLHSTTPSISFTNN